MIEQAMIFALGFCVAGLAALLFLPAVTRRATTMAREQVERQMPLSIEEIVAQRDLLRAEFAAERRKIEQSVERLEDARTHDMAELGRRAAMIASLDTELGDIKRARDAMEVELAATLRTHHETTAENVALQKALWDESGAHDNLAGRFSALSEAHAGLTARAEGLATALATTQAALADHQARLDQAQRELAQHKLDLSLAQQNEAVLGARIQDQEHAVREALDTVATLRARHAEIEGGFSASDLAALRSAVVEIGEKIVRMTDDTEHGDMPSRERRASVS